MTRARKAWIASEEEKQARERRMKEGKKTWEMEEDWKREKLEYDPEQLVRWSVSKLG